MANLFNKNKAVEENPDLKAAQQRLQQKQQKEIEEKVAKITNMNRHQRRAFAKVNGISKIAGTRRDHIEDRKIPVLLLEENERCKGKECINDRRNGSAYCQECSDNFKK